MRHQTWGASLNGTDRPVNFWVGVAAICLLVLLLVAQILWAHLKPDGSGTVSGWRREAGPAVQVMLSGGPRMRPAKRLGRTSSPSLESALDWSDVGDDPVVMAVRAAPAALHWAAQFPDRKREQRELKERLRREALAQLGRLVREDGARVRELEGQQPWFPPSRWHHAWRLGRLRQRMQLSSSAMDRIYRMR